MGGRWEGDVKGVNDDLGRRGERGEGREGGE